MTFRILSIFVVSALVLSACSEKAADEQTKSQTQTKTESKQASATEHGSKLVGAESEKYHEQIAKLAAAADNTVEDGWYFGQEPRILKSFYRKISPSQKADFAIAYHNWMVQFNEDLVSNFKSYVPYSKRVDFAFSWWKENSAEFSKQEGKYKVLWAHESVQDANELWWRAAGNLQTLPADSGLTIAHDEEQRMLFHFMEDEAKQGTISEQIWKRDHEGAQ